MPGSSGAAQLAAVGAALRETGQKELRRELLRDIRLSAKPMTAAIKQSALDKLPHRGGLNQWVASAKITSRTRLAGRSVGVRLIGQKGNHDLEDLDVSGSIRHPVYGHRDRWVSQTVTAQFFTDAVEVHGEIVAAAIEAAIDRVAALVAAS